MDFQAYLNSKYQSPYQGTGEMVHPSSSEFLLQAGSSHSESSYEKLSRMVAASRFGRQFSSNDIDPGILADIPYLAGTMEKNTLFADFPSYTDGSYMDSYLNLPSRPVTLSYPRVTDLSGVDHLLVPVQSWGQQSLMQQNQHTVLQANEASVPSQMKFDCSGQVQKKPRLDPTKDDVIRYMIQQILTSESSKESRSYDSKLIASPGQYQTLHALQRDTIPLAPKSTEVPIICRNIQAPEPHLPLKSCGGIYADQLMQYLHQRSQRPKQNNISHWRKFAAEFFDSNAKKRWCFSNYDVGCHLHFVFSQYAVDSWNCDLCGIKSGRGFEAKFEVLPRLFKLEYDNGLADKIIYLDLPCESTLPTGCFMLRYTKAVQETIYKNSRVVHEGQLCVTFTKELKIISWDFCAHRHEEFVLRRSIAPQVKQLVQVSQKYQDTIDKNKGSGNLRQALLQATNNKFMKAGQQLEKAMNSNVTELGLPKQLARFLQVAEVIDCMKDLFSFSHENKLSPIESLNLYAEATKFKSNQMNQQPFQEDSQGFISTGYTTGSSRQTSFGAQVNTTGSSGQTSFGAQVNTTGSSRQTSFGAQVNTTGSSRQTSFGAQVNTTGSSRQTSFGAQVNTGSVTSPWYPYQNLLARNSVTSSETMMMANPSRPMMSYSDSYGFQGDQDHRKYVLNKQMMQRMFSNGGGVNQEPQLPILMAGGSQTKTKTASATSTSRQRGQRKGPKPASKSRGVKKEIEEMEEFGVPMLPGVKVKKENFYG